MQDSRKNVDFSFLWAEKQFCHQDLVVEIELVDLRFSNRIDIFYNFVTRDSTLKRFQIWSTSI